MIPANLTYGDLIVGVGVVAVLAVVAAYALYELSAVIWAHVVEWRIRQCVKRARSAWPLPYERREELSFTAPLVSACVFAIFALALIVSQWEVIR
jgi:hypothetical protein